MKRSAASRSDCLPASQQVEPWQPSASFCHPRLINITITITIALGSPPTLSPLSKRRPNFDHSRTAKQEPPGARIRARDFICRLPRTRRSKRCARVQLLTDVQRPGLSTSCHVRAHCLPSPCRADRNVYEPSKMMTDGAARRKCTVVSLFCF